MKPALTTYDVGQTRFGQRLTLEENAQGWVLIQHAANQRDDTQRIYVTPIMAAAILDFLS